MDALNLHLNALGQVELVVNGTPLLQLAHDVELPFAEAEYDERIAAGETPEQPRRQRQPRWAVRLPVGAAHVSAV